MEKFPTWAAEEISKAKFEYYETWKNTGYILELNNKENRMDVQFYDKLPDGRHIITLDVAKDFTTNNLELGVVYLFKFKVFKTILSPKLIKLIVEEYSTKMENIYQFEIESVENIEKE